MGEDVLGTLRIKPTEILVSAFFLKDISPGHLGLMYFKQGFGGPGG